MSYSPEDSEENTFESFADIILCICIVLIMLVALLALNVNKKVEELTKPNVYSGGVNRPELYLDVYTHNYSGHKDSPWNSYYKKLYGDQDVLKCHLQSPSYAAADTRVKDGEVFSRNEDESFSGKWRANLDNFLSFAGGIDIGSFQVDGTATSLVIPKFVGKRLLLQEDPLLTTPPSEEMAKRLLGWAWPVMAEKIYPVRKYEEYRHSRCIIYFESEIGKDGQKSILIGNLGFEIPQRIEDGLLDFLTSLSSSLTEMVYLGEYHRYPDRKSNTRIDVFKDLGLHEASDYYVQRIYGGISSLPQEDQYRVSAMLERNSWDRVDQRIKGSWILRHGNIEEARKDWEDNNERRLLSIYRNMRLVGFLQNGYELKDIPKGYLPALVQFPKAWQAYIKRRMAAGPKTPAWVLKEFLIPLGYDKKALDDEVTELLPEDVDDKDSLR